MTWIATKSRSEASGEYKTALDLQAQLYPKEYEGDVPGLPTHDRDGIVAAHSLIPKALGPAFATFGALMDPALPLTRTQHELIAAVVNRCNGTRYCSLSHQAFLRAVTNDQSFADAIGENYRTAELSELDRAICEHAEKLTKQPSQMTRKDVDKLRSLGLDDTGVLQVTQIAAWFNYINRMADGLGVGRE